MPRAGIAYHIDDDWRRRVETTLKTKGWSRADFARETGCDRSLITELLNGTRKQTTYLPEMHKALGWEVPQPPIASPDTGEISYFYERLDEAGRARIMGVAREELDRVLEHRQKPPKPQKTKKNS